MKLKTQFTDLHNPLRDLDYVKKIEVLEETLKKEYTDYPIQEDFLVCFNWISINQFFIAYKF